jgi:cytochrome bd-type quinol oxidase subunit 1
MLKPFQSSPGRMVSMGGLMDVAGISAWNLTVGRKHQKMAAAGLWTMTAFRIYLAVHNHRNEDRAERRQP